ncbi:MAG: fumarate hydratase [Nitrospirae bacterium]|nr:fumarate hydratase [Nitrospirota bacterium]
MLKLQDGIVELYRKVSTSLPNDVEEALQRAYQEEPPGVTRESLSAVIENIRIARSEARPICQDTGVPTFYVQIPRQLSQIEVRETIIEATKRATREIPLRANAVDCITERNSGDNTGKLFPIIYFEETREDRLIIDLMLKGGGSENLGQTYKLPLSELKAQRDFEGIKRCVIDAVFKAQGKGCPPYTIGVAIGASKDQVTYLSKKQLLRRLDEEHPSAELARLERDILEAVNSLGIGPLGFGGRFTALSVKVDCASRHPASYFVDVSFSCWANRRGRLVWG